MKTWLFFVVTLVSLVCTSVLAAQQASDTTEKTVLSLEKQWTESQRTNNPDLLAPLLADKFIETSVEGVVRNKAESLAESRATKYSRAESQDVKVTVFGDTAIATIVWKGQYIDENGKPIDSNSRWTDTWVKMPNGKWQCVATHGSDITK